MLSPLSGALAPADTTSPYWTAADAREERGERGKDNVGRWVGEVAEMKSLRLITYSKEREEEKDAIRMQMKWMIGSGKYSRKERRDEGGRRV